MTRSSLAPMRDRSPHREARPQVSPQELSQFRAHLLELSAKVRGHIENMARLERYMHHR